MQRNLVIALVVSLAWATPAPAQTPPAAAPVAYQKTLAATMNVYVFPAAGRL